MDKGNERKVVSIEIIVTLRIRYSGFYTNLLRLCIVLKVCSIELYLILYYGLLYFGVKNTKYGSELDKLRQVPLHNSFNSISVFLHSYFKKMTFSKDFVIFRLRSV